MVRASDNRLKHFYIFTKHVYIFNFNCSHSQILLHPLAVNWQVEIEHCIPNVLNIALKFNYKADSKGGLYTYIACSYTVKTREFSIISLFTPWSYIYYLRVPVTNSYILRILKLLLSYFPPHGCFVCSLNVLIYTPC